MFFLFSPQSFHLFKKIITQYIEKGKSVKKIYFHSHINTPQFTFLHWLLFIFSYTKYDAKVLKIVVVVVKV